MCTYYDVMGLGSPATQLAGKVKESVAERMVETARVALKQVSSPSLPVSSLVIWCIMFLILLAGGYA